MGQPAYSPRYRKSWALLVGIDRYADARLPPLKTAARGAAAVASVLETQLDFDPANIILLRDEEATQRAIRRALVDPLSQRNKVGPDDRVLIYYGGHGLTFDTAEGEIGCIAPYDIEATYWDTAIPMDELTRLSNRMHAKHVLFLLDACFSGFATTRDASAGVARQLADYLTRPVRQVISAGTREQAVSDVWGPGQHALFTGFLLEGLAGAAPAPGGVLRAFHLAGYLQDQVAQHSRSRQTPQYAALLGSQGGDFILDVRPSESGAVPGQVLAPDVTTSREELLAPQPPAGGLSGLFKKPVLRIAGVGLAVALAASGLILALNGGLPGGRNGQPPASEPGTLADEAAPVLEETPPATSTQGSEMTREQPTEESTPDGEGDTAVDVLVGEDISPDSSPLALASQGWGQYTGNALHSRWSTEGSPLEFPLSVVQSWELEDYVVDAVSYHDETIFAAARHRDGPPNENAVFAFTMNAPDPLWFFEIPGTRDENRMTPLVYGPYVYVTGQHSRLLYALDRDTGLPAYTFESGNFWPNQPSVLDDVLIYRDWLVGGLKAIDTRTWEPLWSALSGSYGNYIPAMSGDLVLARQSSLTALDRVSGEVIWSVDQGHGSEIASDTERVFVVLPSEMHAFELGTGDVAWSYGWSGNVEPTSLLAVTNDFVILVSPEDDGRGRLIAVTREFGTFVADMGVPGGNVHGLAIADSVLFLGSEEGLLAYDLNSFRLIWEDTGIGQVEDIAVAAGHVIVATDLALLVYE